MNELSSDSLKVTFDIPTYNAEKHLRKCLQSILQQDYPSSKIEILVADGGSIDNTVKISKEMGAKVLSNPKRLADFGAKINAKNATGDLFVIFAADNELGSSTWTKDVTKIFQKHPEVSVVWGKIISGKEDPPINKYYELIQSDPLMYFMNKNLEMYLKNSSQHDIDGRKYFLFDVDPNIPLVWGANGIVYRLNLVRDIILDEGFIGDNDVFQKLIEKGFSKVVYMPTLTTYHHHLNSLKIWVEKWRRNYDNHFLNQLTTRNMQWVAVKHFRMKLLIWICYSMVPIFSFSHTIFLLLRDLNRHWLYHPVASFLQCIFLLRISIVSKEGRRMIINTLKRGGLD